MHGFDQDERKQGDEEEEEEEDVQLHRGDGANKQQQSQHHVIHLNDVETRPPSLSVTSAPLLIEKWTKSAMFCWCFHGAKARLVMMLLSCSYH